MTSKCATHQIELNAWIANGWLIALFPIDILGRLDTSFVKVNVSVVSFWVLASVHPVAPHSPKLMLMLLALSGVDKYCHFVFLAAVWVLNTEAVAEAGEEVVVGGAVEATVMAAEKEPAGEVGIVAASTRTTPVVAIHHIWRAERLACGMQNSEPWERNRQTGDRYVCFFPRCRVWICSDHTSVLG